MPTEFEKLKQVLSALEAEEVRVERRKKNRADWSDPEAKREYIREYKKKLREKDLPDPRVCPVCKKAKPKVRQWWRFERALIAGRKDEFAMICREAFGSRKMYAVCRSCGMKELS